MGLNNFYEGGVGALDRELLRQLSQIINTPPNRVSQSQTLTSGDTFQFTPSGDLKPENAVMRITGQETVNSVTGLSLTDGSTVTISGNVKPKNASITIQGGESTNARSVAVSNGGSVTVGGNTDTRNGEVTITGNSNTTTQSYGPIVAGPGFTETYNIGGNQSASNGTFSFQPEVYDGNAIPEDSGTTNSFTLTEDEAWRYDDTSESYLLYGTVSRSLDVSMLSSVSGVEYHTGSNGGQICVATNEYPDDTLGGDGGYGESVPANSSDLFNWEFNEPPLDVYGQDSITLHFYAGDNWPIDVEQVNMRSEGGYEVIDDSGRTTINQYQTGTSTSTSLDISPGSNVTIFSNCVESENDYTISWDETDAVEDPTVSIGGSSVSYTGFLGDTQTHTGTLNSSPGSQNVSVSYSGAAPSQTWDFTEVTQTKDPSASVGSTNVSYNGLLANSYTEDVSLETGDNLVSVSGSGVSPTATADYDEVNATKDPVVVGAGESLYNSGVLQSGVSVEIPLDLQVGQTYTVELLTGEFDALVEVEWDEITE